MIKDKYLTTFDAAAILGFTPDHVRWLIKIGKIKADKIGTMWVIAPKAITHVKRLRKPNKKDEANVGSCE